MQSTNDWILHYYDNDKTTDVNVNSCQHTEGQCKWGRCPKCKKDTLHLYTKAEELNLFDVQECKCGYSDRTRLTPTRAM